MDDTIHVGIKRLFFPPDTTCDLDHYKDIQGKKTPATLIPPEYIPDGFVTVNAPIFCDLYGKDPKNAFLKVNSVVEGKLEEHERLFAHIGLSEGTLHRSAHSIYAMKILETAIPYEGTIEIGDKRLKRRLQLAVELSFEFYGCTHLFCVTEMLGIDPGTQRPELVMVVRGSRVNRKAIIESVFGEGYTLGKAL